ncbi:hypothetical protein Tco_0471719 [Tanacetum coccineum]
MAETIEQYMSKTRADYGSGIARPKIKDKDSLELKGQFLKELRDNTFSVLNHEDANEHIKKVLEIVDLFHIPNITQDQVMLRAFPILEVPTRQILDSKGVISSKTAADAKVVIQEMVEYSKKWHNGTSRTRSTEMDWQRYKHNSIILEEKSRKRETLEEAYYTQFGAPFQEGGYRAIAPGFYRRNNENPSQEENSNIIKEIQASTDAAIRNQGASIKTLEIQIRQLNKVLHERGFGSLPSSTEPNLRDHVKSISTTVEADTNLICRMGSSQYAVSMALNSTLMYEIRQTTILFPSHLNDYYCEEKKGSYRSQFSEAYSYRASHINNFIPQKEKDPRSFTLPCYNNNVCFDNALADLGANRIVKYPKGIDKNVLVGIGKFVSPVDFIILDMPEDIKVPLILERLFLSTAHAKIDVFKHKITLKVGVEKIIFKSVKPASSLIKRVHMLSLRERMELDLEARLMGETLVLNRSIYPLYGDYIELNDLNIPLELRRDQVDDLMPTIEEGEVIEEVITRNDELITGIKDYLSCCDHDKKIHIDCAHNLRFSCMIGFEFLHADFFPILYVNVMYKKFYNSIMKEKLEYKGNNVVGALMNAPIFVGTFYVLTDFVVLDDMDAYRDEGMGDVIFGKPFLREVGIKARRFDGMITIYNGNDEVTYQKVRYHSRFKHHTNEQCNKIPPLLKVSEHDKMNGISHSYQKLKGFYKGVLNLGPDFVRVPTMEEWLTRGHVSVHEMEW